jgi:hypothetical protein
LVKQSTIPRETYKLLFNALTHFNCPYSASSPIPSIPFTLLPPKNLPSKYAIVCLSYMRCKLASDSFALSALSVSRFGDGFLLSTCTGSETSCCGGSGPHSLHDAVGDDEDDAVKLRDRGRAEVGEVGDVGGEEWSQLEVEERGEEGEKC